MISERRPDTIVKILETALANDGVTLVKLLEKLHLSEYPDRLKMYLSILESYGFIVYRKGTGIYRTTYKGMRFSRTFNHTVHLQFGKRTQVV